LARLRSRSCIIHGEAVGCDDNGVAVVNRVRYRHHDESIFLYAFDLIELNRDDLRPDSLEGRKATLEGLGQMTATSLNFALLDANRPQVARRPVVSRPACIFLQRARWDAPQSRFSPHVRPQIRANSHAASSSANFITIIAESDFRYRQPR